MKVEKAGLREELDIFFGNKGFEWSGSQRSAKSSEAESELLAATGDTSAAAATATTNDSDQRMAAAVVVSARLLSAAATAAGAGKSAVEAAKQKLADLQGSKVALVVAIAIVAAEAP